MDIKIRSANLDYLLMAVFTISLVVPSVAQSYGLNAGFFWFPILSFAVWTLITAFIKPNIMADSVEASVVEKLRGWCFVVSLPIALLGNYFVLSFSPVNGYSPFFAIGLILFAIPMGFAVRAFPKVLFKQELAFMKPNEHKLVMQMLMETGAVSIWASVSLLIVNGIYPSLKSLGWISYLGIGLLSAIFLFVAIDRYKRASKLATSLEESLVKSQWHKKYSKAKKTKKVRIW